MERRTLRLEEIAVDSFEVSPVAPGGGTVRAHQDAAGDGTYPGRQSDGRDPLHDTCLPGVCTCYASCPPAVCTAAPACVEVSGACDGVDADGRLG